MRRSEPLVLAAFLLSFVAGWLARPKYDGWKANEELRRTEPVEAWTYEDIARVPFRSEEARKRSQEWFLKNQLGSVYGEGR
jgi:hypothetical protein